MPQQRLRDPEELTSEAMSILRELIVALDRADVSDSIVTDVESIKIELEYIDEQIGDRQHTILASGTDDEAEVPGR